MYSCIKYKVDMNAKLTRTMKNNEIGRKKNRTNTKKTRICKRILNTTEEILLILLICFAFKINDDIIITHSVHRQINTQTHTCTTRKRENKN